MTATELLTLAVVLGLATLVAYLVLVVVPALAQGRMTLELSEARTVLRELEGEEPGILANPHTARLDDFLSSLIRHDRTIGLTVLATVALQLRRQSSEPRPEALPEGLRELSGTQLVALHWVTFWSLSEIVRASFMGSRLWFLVWPVWLWISGRLRRWQARPFATDTRESDQLAEVVWRGVVWDDRVAPVPAA